MTENSASEIGPREWFIAIGVSLVLIVVCVGAGFFVFQRVATPPTQTPGVSTQVINQQAVPSSTSTDEEKPQNLQPAQSERLSFSESLQSSYLFTNPVESVGCLLMIVLLLGSIFLLDVYLRRRREKK